MLIKGLEVNNNVDLIVSEHYRIIQGKMPAEVRRELFAGIKAGKLKRYPRKGLAPEVFYAPQYEAEAFKAVLSYLNMCAMTVRAVTC